MGILQDKYFEKLCRRATKKIKKLNKKIKKSLDKSHANVLQYSCK